MEKIVNNSFFKSIITLASGTIIAQVLAFIASPLMTRLYTPEEIGMYTLLLTAISMFGGVINGRFDMSIVYEESNTNIYSLIKLSFIISIIFSLFVSFFYSLFYYFNNDNIPIFFIFISIFCLLSLTGLSNILISYNNRNKEYKLMSKVGILQSVFREFSIVIFGFFNFGAIGLLLAQIIGMVAGVKKQSESLVTHINEVKDVNLKEIKGIFKKHVRQPIFSVPAIFANSFSYSSINIFIGMLFGTTVLGYYSVSYRILGLPLVLISNNVSKVYFEEAAKEFKENNNYKNTFFKTSFLLLMIAIPMVVILILVSPSVFEWFFGDDYRMAGVYVQILAPMFGVRLIVSPLTTGMLISNKQHYELIVQSFFIVASIISFLIAKQYDVNTEVYLMMISYLFILVYIIYFILLFKLAKNNK